MSTFPPPPSQRGSSSSSTPSSSASQYQQQQNRELNDEENTRMRMLRQEFEQEQQQQLQQDASGAWMPSEVANIFMWSYQKWITSPLDRIKFAVQTGLENRVHLTSGQKQILPQALLEDHAWGVARHILNTEGVRGLFRGAGLAWVSSSVQGLGSLGIAHAVDWVVAPPTNALPSADLRQHQQKHHLDPEQEQASIASARFEATLSRRIFWSTLFSITLAFLAFPLEVVRILRYCDMIYPQAGAKHFMHPRVGDFVKDLKSNKFVFTTVPKSMIEDASPTVLNALRYVALWRGFALSFFISIFYRTSHFLMTQAGLRLLFFNKTPGQPEHNPTASTEFMFGLGLSASATAICYPLDVLRSRYIKSAFVRMPGAGVSPRIDLTSTAKMIYKHEGFNGFFRGFAFAIGCRAMVLGVSAFVVPSAAQKLAPHPESRQHQHQQHHNLAQSNYPKLK